MGNGPYNELVDAQELADMIFVGLEESTRPRRGAIGYLFLEIPRKILLGIARFLDRRPREFGKKLSAQLADLAVTHHEALGNTFTRLLSPPLCDIEPAYSRLEDLLGRESLTELEEQELERLLDGKSVIIADESWENSA